MKNQRNKPYSILLLLILLFLNSCKTHYIDNRSTTTEVINKEFQVKCTKKSKPKKYYSGDLVCTKKKIVISENEFLKINFVITNEKSEDPYEYGYQELLRYKNGTVINKLKLRRDDDAHWSETPFVRIREQKYLHDLDNDGLLEFAVFPFHPGSAVWGTARIYSLRKGEIKYWGKGRYQFEGDTYVKLNCMKCSKFNKSACTKCM